MISPRSANGFSVTAVGRFLALSVLALTLIALTFSYLHRPPPIHSFNPRPPTRGPPPPPPPGSQFDTPPPRGLDSAPLCSIPMLLPGHIDDKTSTYRPSPLCRSSTVALSSLPHQLENLRDKTFAVYGDSIMRFLMEHVCDAYNGTTTIEHSLTPPGLHVRDPHHQSVHSCHVSSVNFTMYNVYLMGIRKWRNSTIDREFTRHHSTFSFQEDPSVWRFENRIRLVHDLASKRFGSADAVLLGTGVWDLVQLHHETLEAAVERGEKQTPEPPEDWVAAYRERVRKFIRLAYSLHSAPHAPEGKLKNVFMMSLHDLDLYYDTWRKWQMDGMPEAWQEKMEFNPLKEQRVRRLKHVQMEVVAEEEERLKREGMGSGKVMTLPYDMWVREVHPERRLLDIVHPGPEMNKWAALGIATIAKYL